jgi:hypothetical protein
MSSVIQSWLSQDNITLKQQTVVLTGLRGCDNQSKYDISKKLVKKIRTVVLINADAKNSDFMKNTMSIDELKTFVSDIGKYPTHFISHVCGCCQIIAYKHPDKYIRDWFYVAYTLIAEELNLNIETEVQCDDRLGDQL